uniref:Uncharacterized protein n=1 Tax=Mesocestoides corti TaxID=53468 RepID=A0A5K3FZR0_MESCO
MNCVGSRWKYKKALLQGPCPKHRRKHHWKCPMSL